MTPPTMMLKFQFGYSENPSEEALAAMQPYVREPLLPYKPYREYTGQFPELFAVAPKGMELRVCGESIPLTTFETLLNRLAAIEQKVSAPAPVNERCSVIVPGVGTLMLDEVTAVLDPCTERLQEYLNEGWRILAVCVQPDQRRPDYVLGRKR